MTNQINNRMTPYKFWDFVQATGTNPPELLLYGAICNWQDEENSNITPQQFNKELEALGNPSEIIVRINSGGGDVFAANAIFTRLKGCKAKITVEIDGWAASAATIIAMAGDTVRIAKNGVFMIHDPAMVVFGQYQAKDFEKMAGELDVIKQSIVNAYLMKTNGNPEEIAGFMSNETWWTGEDAIKNGFCDELMLEDAEIEARGDSALVVNGLEFDISRFKNFGDIRDKIVFNSPKNPGCFTDSATITKQNEEVKSMGADNETINTVDALKTAYPDLVAQIENAAAQAAAKAERERIKAVHDLSLEGYEDIAQDAMFDNPATAEQVAIKIIAKQKEQGNQYLADRKADASDDHVNEVGAGTQTQTGAKDGVNEYEAAIDALFPDAQ